MIPLLGQKSEEFESFLTCAPNYARQDLASESVVWATFLPGSHFLVELGRGCLMQRESKSKQPLRQRGRKVVTDPQARSFVRKVVPRESPDGRR